MACLWLAVETQEGRAIKELATGGRFCQPKLQHALLSVYRLGTVVGSQIETNHIGNFINCAIFADGECYFLSNIMLIKSK